nr:11545_t:CDS:2 [Entrophospora candida]
MTREKKKKGSRGNYNPNSCERHKKSKRKCQLSCPDRYNIIVDNEELDENAKNHFLNGNNIDFDNRETNIIPAGDIIGGSPTSSSNKKNTINDFEELKKINPKNNLSNENFLDDSFTYRMMKEPSVPWVETPWHECEFEIKKYIFTKRLGCECGGVY